MIEKCNETATESYPKSMTFGETDGKVPTPRTLGQELDAGIMQARKHLEQLCVSKAKAEVLGLLDSPHRDLMQIVNGYPY